jgi:hypothetical protein
LRENSRKDQEEIHKLRQLSIKNEPKNKNPFFKDSFLNSHLKEMQEEILKNCNLEREKKVYL